MPLAGNFGNGALTIALTPVAPQIMISVPRGPLLGRAQLQFGATVAEMLPFNDLDVAIDADVIIGKPGLLVLNTALVDKLPRELALRHGLRLGSLIGHVSGADTRRRMAPWSQQMARDTPERRLAELRLPLSRADNCTSSVAG